MVEEDAHLAVVTAGVTEGVLHGGNIASGGASKLVGAHGNAHVTLELHLVVLVHAGGPALATVDGKAAILLVATLNGIAAHKVGHGLLSGGAESVLGSLGGLEHHITVAIGIELASRLSSSLDVVTTLLVDRRDLGNGSSPLGLDLKNLSLSHRHRFGGRRCGKRHRGMVEEDANFVVAAAGVTEVK